MSCAESAESEGASQAFANEGDFGLTASDAAIQCGLRLSCLGFMQKSAGLRTKTRLTRTGGALAFVPAALARCLAASAIGLTPERAYAAVSAVMALGPSGPCKAWMLLHVPPSRTQSYSIAPKNWNLIKFV